VRKKVIEINELRHEVEGFTKEFGWFAPNVKAGAKMLEAKLTSLNYKSYQPGEQRALVAAWKFLLNVYYTRVWMGEARSNGKVAKAEYLKARNSFLTTFANATPEDVRKSDAGVESSGHTIATWNVALRLMSVASSTGNKEDWLLGGKALVWLVESGAYYGWE